MSSSIPPATDPSAAAPSDRLWLRSELMGTQVITRDTGRRLGVVGEVVVDIDRREVVALGLRDNPLTRFLPGLPRWMPLECIRQVGDVILVDSADSLSETFNPERYSKVINCQVITESGVTLGRVLGFSFDIETGELSTLVIGALGVPLLGEGVLSTWELTVGEIVSSGTDRIIVYEGAEEKLRQLGTGLLEKLGIGGNSWEQEERERFRSGMIPAENQLPAGTPSASEQRRIQPATSRAVLPESELDYVELEERREREPLRQRLYLDEDDRDMGPARGRDPYGEQRWNPEDERDRAYGGRYDDGPGYGTAPGPQERWRTPEPDPGFEAPRRRLEDGEDEDAPLAGQPLRRPRSEDRSWQESDPLGRGRDPEAAPSRRDREAAVRGGGDRDERLRPDREPWRNDRSDRADDAAEPQPLRAAANDPAPARQRQPLQASPAPSRPPAGPLSEAPAGADRSLEREPPRRLGASGGEREPIDVEPEVLDDPW